MQTRIGKNFPLRDEYINGPENSTEQKIRSNWPKELGKISTDSREKTPVLA